MLADIGYEVTCAIDGKEGFRRFRALQPDLVITDIIMPEREGIETIIMIRGLEPGAKIIALSAGGRRGAMDFLKVAAKVGADHALAKPFEPDVLINLVRQTLFPEALSGQIVCRRHNEKLSQDHSWTEEPRLVQAERRSDAARCRFASR
jgi:CheY-like chemotaxis protein